MKGNGRRSLGENHFSLHGQDPSPSQPPSGTEAPSPKEMERLNGARSLSLLLAPSYEALLLIFAVVFGPPFPHHTFPATREETAEEGIFSPAYFRKTHKWPHSEAPNQRCVKINKPTIQMYILFFLENYKMILAMEPFFRCASNGVNP